MIKKILPLSLMMFLSIDSVWSADIESISGDYTGNVVDASGVAASKGDVCKVSIDPNGKANTVRFHIDRAKFPVYVEREVVKKNLASGEKKVKLKTRGERGGNVFIILQFRGERLHFIRAKVVSFKVNWTLACGSLTES